MGPLVCAVRALMARHEQSAVTYVDTMALRFISSTPTSLVKVTNASPVTRINTVSGSIPVDTIGVAGLNVADRSGGWHYFELPDAHVASRATCELYPVQLAFAVLGARHVFDDVNEIRFPDGISRLRGESD